MEPLSVRICLKYPKLKISESRHKEMRLGFGYKCAEAMQDTGFQRTTQSLSMLLGPNKNIFGRFGAYTETKNTSTRCRGPKIRLHVSTRVPTKVTAFTCLLDQQTFKHLAQPYMFWRTHYTKSDPKSMRVMPLCLWGV